MSLSNQNGRALEFAYLLVFEKELAKQGNILIEQNSSYFASKTAWDATDSIMQKTFISSATAGIKAICDAEPLITERNGDGLKLMIQPDQVGKEGDVRDILVIRSEIGWEIGLSVKNNHFAVKHSRLSSKLDFGDKWFGIKCSQDYWNDIRPIFQYLSDCKQKKLKWNELQSKEDDVYVPLLTAFLKEIKKSYKTHGEVLAKGMVEYLIGKYDFYKTVGINKKELTQIQPYNFRGMLNKASKIKKPKLIIPISSFPKRIFSADFKPNSNNTVEIIMDEGWQFGFRIHNASTKVEASLKFDVQIIGMPTTIICIDYR